MENIMQDLRDLRDNTKQSRTHSIVDEINKKLTHLTNISDTYESP